MRFAVLMAAVVLATSVRVSGSDLGGGMEFAAALLEKDAVKRAGMLLAAAERDGYPSDLALVHLTRSALDPAWAPRLAILAEKRRGELIPALLAMRVSNGSGIKARAAALTAWKAAAQREPDAFEKPLFRELSGYVLRAANASGACDEVRPELEKLILRHPENWRRLLPSSAVLEFYYGCAFRASGFELLSPEWNDSRLPECRAFVKLLAEQEKILPDDGPEADRLIRFYLFLDEKKAALALALEFARRHASPATLGMVIFTAIEAGEPEIFDSLAKVVKPESLPVLKASACLRAGNFAEAEKLISSVTSPKERTQLKFKMLSAKGDFRGAAEFALKHPELPPNDRVMALLAAAELHGEEKYYREAEKLSSDAMRRDPVPANALGFVALELGMDPAPAEKLIRAALEREPENCAYLDSMAVARRRAGDLAGAWEWMSRALKTMTPHASSGEILEHAGDIRRDLGDREQARHFYRAALKLVRRGGGANLKRLEKRIEAKLETDK